MFFMPTSRLTGHRENKTPALYCGGFKLMGKLCQGDYLPWECYTPKRTDLFFENVGKEVHMRIKIDVERMSEMTCIPSDTIIRALDGKHPETLFHYFVRSLGKNRSPDAAQKAIVSYYLWTRARAGEPSKEDIREITDFFRRAFMDEDPNKALLTWKDIPKKFREIVLEIFIGCLHAQRNTYIREHAHRFRK